MALTFLHFHGFLRLYFCRCFEDSLSSYTGDDPLDPWDKLVEYLEQMRPAEGGGMSLVLDSLVQRFLNVERYANDVRYVNYCIKCARHRSDPVAPYGHVFGRGVGGGTAAPYAARARRPELRGTDEQADAVDQKAVENRARPADAVLHEYRRFQTRTRIPAPASAGRTALQNSHLTDQMSSDGQAQSVPSVECLVPVSKKTTPSGLNDWRAEKEQKEQKEQKEGVRSLTAGTRSRPRRSSETRSATPRRSTPPSGSWTPAARRTEAPPRASAPLRCPVHHLPGQQPQTKRKPPPPAVLSFRDQTLCPADSSGTSAASARPGSEPFQITEEPDEPAYDVPMSPECALKPDWLSVRSPEAAVEPDPDAFVSPRRPDAPSTRNRDVPMSPEQPRLCADEPVMSPHGEPSADVSMNAATAAVHLVSDPWDDQLISGLLASLTPPLSAHPCCVSWRCGVPSFSPGRTLSMGTSSLRVDGVLGEGAFATVYQATNPVTSEKVVLKVQKPANPWEFYIHTQPDARLQPAVRHLYGRVSSAHLFHDGSVPVGELHDYGTLLNAVNVYKSLSDEAMPPPLVLYFSVCILRTLERPHAARIVHADVKPDNFLLGERFLENSCFDPDGVDHGLVLIDLGQSIDMRLFPEGTAFTARCLTSGFQCTEMLSGKPWSYQTDYFGLAGTVHCMLFGTYMQVTKDGGVWKTNDVFRR
ncbi:LOW QUALITY PROTEIN: mitotic checkpoint serine/threonine-protein kinase bub-1-like [Embiotoca jacksoni]|uniref:LOW QUALITY PROTEIN: mitotic checkpoint serine/threonine-protein kinase bub-1-like n=1 Tax=Embiotoca jacksoni TaxID=100190 RepID=UPI00370392F0